MSAPLNRVFAALRERGLAPRKAGRGWVCRCPSHEDRNPSLSIGIGDDGRVLVNCHAGCTLDAVCSALTLRPADLFADDLSRRIDYAPKPPQRGDGDENARDIAPESNSVAVASVASKGNTFPTARDAVAELERRHGPRTASWTYTNAVGDPVGVVVRWNTPAGKDVRPVSIRADRSGWCIEGMPTPRPLYRLPELLAALSDRVFVVEGEKAADAAQSVGLMATTSPHGSNSASKADWTPMAGRDVVVLPDRDDAGERYAADVARLAMAAGAKSVRVVRLAELWAGMPVKGDMADFVEHRGRDSEQIRAEVEAQADKAEPVHVTPKAPAVPAFKPFPVDVLPEPVRGFVSQAAMAIGCDTSYIALPLLSGLAAAIGNTRRIALKRGWTEPAIVWTAIVGESGTMKTPAFKLAMKATRKAQDAAFKQHESAVAAWEVQQQRYEAELASWKQRAAKGGSDGSEPPDKPVRPIARRLLVSDTTTEALAPILQGNPRGVLLARDELAGWLGSFDRYAKAGKAGADSAHWLSMHNGEEMTIDRKTGIPPTIRVPSASVSITGGIQPGILRRALGQEHHESGMAARVLYAMPPRKAKRWTEADLDAESEAAMAAVFGRLFSLAMEVDPQSEDPLSPDLRPQLVRLAADGKRAWVAFYDQHASEQVNLSGDEAAAWSKLEGYAARLALVVHLTRWAAGDATLRDSALVDEASIAAGVVLTRWFGDEFRRVHAILSESDEGRESRRLVEWIERNGGSVTVRDLTRGPREYRGDPERAADALGDLVAAGVGRWELDDHAGGRGRPADRFRLLSRCGDPGDGDVSGENPGDRGNSVTVATRTDAGEGWGEL